MTEAVRPRRLRGFLLGVSAALFTGTVVELVAVEHYADRLQLIPFALCGLGLLALAAVWRRPARGTVLALRGVMAAAAAGSLVGVYFHVVGNLEFARELRPDAGTWELAWETVTGGNPIGASGILLVGAALAIAATAGSGSPAPAPEATDRHVAGQRRASWWELGDA